MSGGMVKTPEHYGDFTRCLIIDESLFIQNKSLVSIYGVTGGK
jgi:hypothetical protein